MDREPKLRVLLFSPAQQAIEFVGRAVPAVRPEPKFTDEVPLMRPVATGAPRAAGGIDRQGLALGGAGMLGLGAALVFAGRPAPRSPA
jgi:hypothetical protein